MVNRDHIKDLAFASGFDLCGVASASVIPQAQRNFQGWLQSGLQGKMTYLSKEPERRTDPTRVMSDARSVIVLGLNYFQRNESDSRVGSGRVSRYARGRDYHKVIEKKIRMLIERLKETDAAARDAQFKSFVDYGPVLERAYAERAGLGFLGKNGMLINRKFGSWIFLSEILTDLDIEPDDPRLINHGRCGTCRRCIDACPTGAIVADGVVDARRCISYLTIERPSAIQPDLAERMGDLIFGCDVCQEVCPHNGRAVVTTHEELLPAYGVGELIDCQALLSLTSREQFLGIVSGTPLMRPGLQAFQRNALIVTTNQNRRSTSSFDPADA